MDVNVNWIAIILAAISTMIVGSLWYGPLFGKMWTRLAKVKTDPNFTGGKMAFMYIKAFLASMVTAIILAYAIAVTHLASSNSYFMNALSVGILLWFGFTAARIFMHDLFEGRRQKLTALNIMHEFVTIVIMSIIIGLLPV
jgi:hypothetical protein